jgi:hypothetical protein
VVQRLCGLGLVDLGDGPPMRTWASRRLSNCHRLSSSSRSRLLNDSIQAFCHGEPGSMNTHAVLRCRAILAHPGTPTPQPRKGCRRRRCATARDGEALPRRCYRPCTFVECRPGLGRGAQRPGVQQVAVRGDHRTPSKLQGVSVAVRPPTPGRPD